MYSCSLYIYFIYCAIFRDLSSYLQAAQLAQIYGDQQKRVLL
ncbi:hypothetical protein GPUN_1174 [Glaciecola punicea ACAM 611]|uniref:Uncharacterized protein n=1 Tax=Glaciecola punicea ACAM 611 TaxID=1121923 RepID=H5TAH6_9ALTE|nr:hypothetical protein GPUN_1174 [Glaciecola punicea ACAM 611]